MTPRSGSVLAPPDPMLPGWIGPYAVLRRLGRGGEGTVYLGTSRMTGPVAVKVIGDRSTDYRDPTCLTEFLFLRRIDPVHIAAPIGVGTSHAGNYLATAYRPDFVPAHGLAAGRLDDDRLWRIAAGAALALTAIHRAGIIHCDIKPSNVLVSPDDDVRVIDFGISRDQHGQADDVPRVYCSRGWAAPEQLGPGPLTPAVDVLGWGCLIAFLASGHAPYAAETEAEWILRVRSNRPDLDALPTGLDTLVQAALNRQPARRPTAKDLAQVCTYETSRPRHAQPMPPAAAPAAVRSERTPEHTRTGAYQSGETSHDTGLGVGPAANRSIHGVSQHGMDRGTART